MTAEALLREQVENGASAYRVGNFVYSLNPPETMYGYTYHANLIPPFRPEHTLILGYGQGQVAHLIRKIWGSVKITGVDLNMDGAEYQEYALVKADAYDYIRNCTNSLIKKRFDYIVIDLWQGGEVCDFVYESDFAKRIKQMTKKLMSINTVEDDMPLMKPYYDQGFEFDRFVPIDANRVIYWSVK